MPKNSAHARDGGHSRPLRIACVHLYDDLSGSGKVFRQAIAELEELGAEVRVTVSSAGEPGFIRSSHPTRQVYYRVSQGSGTLQLLLFALAQSRLFLDVLDSCLLWHADVVYANTVMTPGAQLAGWLCDRTVVVHLHETSLGSRALFAGLIRATRAFSDQIICVSQYMRDALRLSDHQSLVVHNSLPRAEWLLAREIAATRRDDSTSPFVVVMACSIVPHKGIDAFLALAARVQAHAEHVTRPICFRLILNGERAEWLKLASRLEVSDNVTIVMRPPDIYRHYREASLVLNLTHRAVCVETFGLTLLEAMTCGVPVVSPVVGGCTELFEDGRGGWRLDSTDIEAIMRLICELATDHRRWLEASQAARANAARFHPDRFSSGLRAALISVARSSPAGPAQI
jgi:glycosyltransferase involved in cell wall biosynthesis